MTRTVGLIVTALAYASFNDSDIKEATEKLLESLDRDLAESEYEQSSDTEKAETELEEVLNSADDASERLEAALVDAEPIEEDTDDTGGDE